MGKVVVQAGGQVLIKKSSYSVEILFQKVQWRQGGIFSVGYSALVEDQ